MTLWGANVCNCVQLRMHLSTPALCLGLSLLCVVLSARVEVSLDAGWRTAPAARPACDFPAVLPSVVCRITGPVGQTCWSAAGVTTMSECAAAACAANRVLFSWGSSNASAPAACWLGDASKLQTDAGALWTTYMRAPSAPTSAPEASPAFDDRAWAVVDLPHDAAAHTPHTPNATGGEGFRQPVQSWYRKHFTLPAPFVAGEALFLNVEAALVESRWWVNGVALVPVYASSSGYLPITLRLDGVPGLVLSYGGGDNVLAGACCAVSLTCAATVALNHTPSLPPPPFSVHG